VARFETSGQSFPRAVEQEPDSGVASPEIWRVPKNLGMGKMFDSRRITLFCLEKRLSKHKMTIFSKNFVGVWPLWPPLATPMEPDPGVGVQSPSPINFGWLEPELEIWVPVQQT